MKQLKPEILDMSLLKKQLKSGEINIKIFD